MSLTSSSSDRATAMHLAAIHGHTVVVRWLHEHGLDAAAEMGNGLTPAIIASQCGDVKMLQLLQDIGVDVLETNSAGQTAFEFAYNPATKEFFAALQRGKHFSDQELEKQQQQIDSLVRTAAAAGNLAILQKMHTGGMVPNASRHSNGSTAMHAATMGGHLAVVKWLHEQGFDATAQTGKGFTPAIIASQRGDVKMLQLLDDIGVDLWANNSAGKAAVEFAKTPAAIAYFAAALAEKGKSTSKAREMAELENFRKNLLKQAEGGDPEAQFHLGCLFAEQDDHAQGRLVAAIGRARV